VATLLPLYAGSVTHERAEQLVKLLENQHAFGPAYPVPSVPTNSFWFRPKLYWQGPTWVNINWLVIDGLKRYGFKDHAAALTESTLEMVKKSGCYEYFDPLTGEPAGTANFSWTAALVMDLLKTK
jgi:glycogen debranching enzyme